MTHLRHFAQCGKKQGDGSGLNVGRAGWDAPRWAWVCHITHLQRCSSVISHDHRSSKCVISPTNCANMALAWALLRVISPTSRHGMALALRRTRVPVGTRAHTRWRTSQLCHMPHLLVIHARTRTRTRACAKTRCPRTQTYTRMRSILTRTRTGTHGHDPGFLSYAREGHATPLLRAQARESRDFLSL